VLLSHSCPDVSIFCNSFEHALLCDIMLGEENGYQVLRRVRQLEAERRVSLEERIPAIALSGYAQTEVRRAQMGGFHLHLTKPVPAENLNESIRQVAWASVHNQERAQ
jgi:ATP-binding cassette subfamily B protein